MTTLGGSGQGFDTRPLGCVRGDRVVCTGDLNNFDALDAGVKGRRRVDGACGRNPEGVTACATVDRVEIAERNSRASIVVTDDDVVAGGAGDVVNTSSEPRSSHKAETRTAIGFAADDPAFFSVLPFWIAKALPNWGLSPPVLHLFVWSGPFLCGRMLCSAGLSRMVWRAGGWDGQRPDPPGLKFLP